MDHACSESREQSRRQRADLAEALQAIAEVPQLQAGQHKTDAGACSFLHFKLNAPKSHKSGLSLQDVDVAAAAQSNAAPHMGHARKLRSLPAEDGKCPAAIPVP